jgi:hypothetical protein
MLSPRRTGRRRNRSCRGRRTAWQTLAAVNHSTLILQPVVAASDDARELWSIVAVLIVLGIGLVILAVAVFRVTRPDRELLAPLEVMGRRKWRSADPVWQRRELDAVRPPGAEPLSPTRVRPVPLAGFDTGSTAPGFDDSHGDDELGPDELVDVGIDAGLVGLPGGEVFDPDPTPPSTEVPVIAIEDAGGDLSLAQLGVGWSAPVPEDLTADVEAPHLAVDTGSDRNALAEEPAGFVAADETSHTAIGHGVSDTFVDDANTDVGLDDDTAKGIAHDDAMEAVSVDDDAREGDAVEGESNDIVR